jgi:hypothetical protein
VHANQAHGNGKKLNNSPHTELGNAKMPLSLDQSESLTEPFNRKTKRPLSPRHSKSNSCAKEESITKSPVSSQRIAGFWSTERLERPSGANFLDTRAGTWRDKQFACQNRCEPPPEFPLASLYSAIISRVLPSFQRFSGSSPRKESTVHPVRAPHTILKPLKSACDLRF